MAKGLEALETENAPETRGEWGELAKFVEKVETVVAAPRVTRASPDDVIVKMLQKAFPTCCSSETVHEVVAEPLIAICSWLSKDRLLRQPHSCLSVPSIGVHVIGRRACMGHGKCHQALIWVEAK